MYVGLISSRTVFTSCLHGFAQVFPGVRTAFMYYTMMICRAHEWGPLGVPVMTYAYDLACKFRALDVGQPHQAVCPRQCPSLAG